VREYIGYEVYKNNNQIPLTNKSDLKEGDEIIIDAPWAKDGKIKATVICLKSGNLYAQTLPHYGSLLSFSEDDRKCWIASCFVSMKGITHFEMFLDTKNKISYCKRCNMQNEYIDYNPDYLCYSCRS